jgi:hypothetical protein
MKTTDLKQIRADYTTGTASDVEIIRGAKGTGKTTHLINNVINESLKDVIFIHPTAKNSKRKFQAKNGEISIFFINSRDFKKEFKASDINNCTLIFDEAKRIINQNTNENFTNEFINFLSISRHQNVSIYLVYHFLKKVSDNILVLADRLTLYKSSENIENLRELFPDNFEAIKEAQTAVNKNKNEYFRKTININF